MAYVGHRGLFLQEQSKTLKITEIHKTYLLPADLTTFPIDFKIVLPTHQIWWHYDNFYHIYGTIKFFQGFPKSLKSAINGAKIVGMA